MLQSEKIGTMEYWEEGSLACRLLSWDAECGEGHWGPLVLHLLSASAGT